MVDAAVADPPQQITTSGIHQHGIGEWLMKLWRLGVLY